MSRRARLFSLGSVSGMRAQLAKKSEASSRVEGPAACHFPSSDGIRCHVVEFTFGKGERRFRR